MASSIWSALEGNMTGVGGVFSGTSGGGGVGDALLNNQLASALSTMGSDAQYWEESSISPTTIRNSLQEADPANPAHTHTYVRALKWLLASMSKGRDVSDFYASVVKLVGISNLQVRKMVYMYLVQYANHNATTRELSLLSINSFQRGLADQEPLIRALALRVLTSIRIADILQIQILAVQKCSQDSSPYVRKCAANAVAKLATHDTNSANNAVLHEIIKTLLHQDESTMVLTSACIAFCDVCPDRLEWLHGCFSKICHLLTDMDEWGQVVVIDLLSRYCRSFFKEPAAWKHGTAERIDRERRVFRSRKGIITTTAGAPSSALVVDPIQTTTTTTLPPHSTRRKIIKRRVVKKGFYSDEEDESTEEEVYTHQEETTAPTTEQTGMTPISSIMDDNEDAELAPDHRKLLYAAMPLLKSRNAGVVLAVCSLQYYCGVSSIKVRTAMGKALVRIHRDRREIQYVVLRAIQTLALECPSAFAPFLHDFFVTAMDPPFTRLIKLDILTSLALEPAAIQVVLKELSSYVRRSDQEFACAAIRATGRVTEMARIVYDRHGETTDRNEANQIALNCLQGLLTLTQTSDLTVVVGESVQVMQCILRMLRSDAVTDNKDDPKYVHDRHHVQARAMRRILLLMIYTVSCRRDAREQADHAGSDDDEEKKEPSELEKVAVCLPERANASAIWIVGEYLAQPPSNSFVFGKSNGKNPSKLRLEVLRCLARSFVELHDCEKEQALHFTAKLLVSAGNVAPEEGPLCEQILSMGRVDVIPEVRDQARFNSGVVHVSMGLKHDADNMDSLPPSLGGRKLSLGNAKQIFLGTKPPASFLPVEDEFRTESGETEGFRFGTLSSLVGHRARSAYLPLPPWASENSPDSLREPAQRISTPRETGTNNIGGKETFYESSSDDEGSTSSSESSTSESSSSASSDSSRDESSSSESSSDDESEKQTREQQVSSVQQLIPMEQTTSVPGDSLLPTTQVVTVASESSSEESSSSDDSSEEEEEEQVHDDVVGSLIPMGGGRGGTSSVPSRPTETSVTDDLKGLVLAPVVVDVQAEPTNPDFERDSGAWVQLVRPDHANGLSVKIRYLRSITKSKQAQLLGLTVDKPTVVCIQVRFENEKKGNGSFRRLRVLQRSAATSSSIIRPLKVVVPAEITQLQAGQRTDCVMGIDFAGASDRDGSMQARLDIKFGGGGIPVEIKPSIGDLLLPCKRSVSDFDAAMDRLQGFQRVEASFSPPSSSPSSLIDRLLAVAAWTCVGPVDAATRLRLVGTLPASGDPVYVLVDEDKGKVTVCCDHALVVSSILNLVKKALQD